MFRKLFQKLNKTVSKQVVSSRHDFEFPIRLTFEPDRSTGKLQMPVNSLSIIGTTKDLSQTGIAFIVPAVRLKEYYLVGEGRTLNAELELPNGMCKLQIIGQRYEQIGKHISVSQYLIGAKITYMADDSREIYQFFLRNGKRIGKSRRARRSLKLGIDES